MKKLWLCLIFALVGAGCATMPLLTEAELPEGSKLVAGGLSLQWTAPMDGTAIFLEATSGTLVMSESLRTGDQFAFNPLESDKVKLLNRLFSRTKDLSKAHSLLPLPKDALFLLYFAPAELEDGTMLPTPANNTHLAGYRVLIRRPSEAVRGR